MRVFTKIAKYFSSAEPEMPGPLEDYWYNDAAGPSALASSGVAVTVDRALRQAAVMSCVKVRSETVASLPLHVYRRGPGDTQDKAYDHPLYHVLHSQANRRHTSFEWREFGMNCCCLRGNAVSLKQSGRRGSVSALIPVPPSSLHIEKLRNGSLAYNVTMSNGSKKQYGEEDVIHIRGMSLDGLVGLSPIEYARETIGLTISAEEHGARFFRTGGRATSHLKCMGKVSKETKAAYSRRISQMQAAGCIVTDEGFEWTPLSVTNEDMQFLESRKFQLADIARLFRVPLHLIQEHEKSTSWGTGIESFNRQFVTHTIRPWLVRWEQRLNADLFGEDSDYFVEFNVDGLLRGDTLPRYQAHEIGIRSRFMTPNEVRKIEGLNPIDGGDDFPPIAGAVNANPQNEKTQEVNDDD